MDKIISMLLDSHSAMRVNINVKGVLVLALSLLATIFLPPSLTHAASPTFGETLPIPEGCSPGFAVGYMFDNYESAEYVDGLLRIHLRTKLPYGATGRLWYSIGRSYAEGTCYSPAVGNIVRPYNRTNLTPGYINFSIRFIDSGHYEIWNDDLEMKEVCTACQGSAIGKIFSFYASIDGGASRLQTTPYYIEEANANLTPDPLIIIPGILGSWQKDGEWVIDPVLHTYDNLIATLEANGYEEGQTLFTFPYDWRNSNIFTAGLLRNKINEVQEICQCEKVDLVAHSMGGLVARYLIQSGLYEGDVDQLIFLATPHIVF